MVILKTYQIICIKYDQLWPAERAFWLNISAVTKNDNGPGAIAKQKINAEKANIKQTTIHVY